MTEERKPDRKLDLTVELQEQGELNEKIIMELRDLKITEGKTDIL